MATFMQWQRGGRKVSRVCWVCGPESLLVSEVCAAYRELVPSAVLWDGGREEELLWDDLLTLPSGPRRAVIRNAQLLRRPDRIPLLLGDEFDGSFAVLLSEEGDFSHDGPGKKLVPHLAALRDSRHGQLIRCCFPKGEEEKAALVASWWPGAGRNTGAELLEYCGGSLAEARNAARKAVLAGWPPSREAVAALGPAGAGGGYADHVVAGSRSAAMQAAACMAPEEAGAVLGLLAARLGLLALLNEAQAKGVSPQELAVRLKVSPYVLRLLRRHAPSYDHKRVGRCREVLALAESAWRAGARTGILEAVAALW